MANASDYNRIMRKAWDGVPAQQMSNVWKRHAASYVRAFWKSQTERKFRWKIRLGTGNRRSWLQDGVFTVNPDQGWHDINHDLSHFIERRTSGDGHGEGHLERERLGAQLIRRRFLEEEPEPVIKKAPVDLIAKRAASVDTRIEKWEKKLKRATAALRKLKKQKRYYVKKLSEPRPVPKPRKKPAKRLNVFEFGEKHGVDIEREDWGDGNIKYIVVPKEGCDTDADPYWGDHYVHDVKEARERVLVYAGVLNHEAADA